MSILRFDKTTKDDRGNVVDFRHDICWKCEFCGFDGEQRFSLEEMRKYFVTNKQGMHVYVDPEPTDYMRHVREECIEIAKALTVPFAKQKSNE